MSAVHKNDFVCVCVVISHSYKSSSLFSLQTICYFVFASVQSGVYHFTTLRSSDFVFTPFGRHTQTKQSTNRNSILTRNNSTNCSAQVLKVAQKAKSARISRDSKHYVNFVSRMRWWSKVIFSEEKTCIDSKRT